MPKREIFGLLAALGFTAQLTSGQLEPDCNPLKADCPAKKAWPKDSYYIDFTKETGPPANWVIASYEEVNFGPRGAEFTYKERRDAPNMWTDFYMLGGRYDVEMQIAPGQGVVSSAVLWSDIQDEIDWEFSGNQHGEKPFPPADGMWTVETNIFTQGKMWDGAATYQKDVYKPTEQFHKYSVEWDENHMNWYVDDKVVRSVQAKDTPNGFVFPQSPMKLQLGVWGGGDPDNNYWTIQWAGGEIDMAGVPYTMYVKSVNITNKYPACQYKYKDRSVAAATDMPSSSSAAAVSQTSASESAATYAASSAAPSSVSAAASDSSTSSSAAASSSGAPSPASSSADASSSAVSVTSAPASSDAVGASYAMSSPSSSGARRYHRLVVPADPRRRL
ncbi:concanavalin A-like lectin/glucanase domain-containing protein [Xylariomycetidae sp. FL2044]|nr:concanavalin A-like lectin/glucanase domain-containing protein [Xylariomycetidae sp. FL2044]